MKWSNIYPLQVAALKAGMAVETARKYVRAGGEIVKKESTRIYADAFASVREEIERKLQASPRLQAKTLMQWLIVAD